MQYRESRCRSHTQAGATGKRHKKKRALKRLKAVLVIVECGFYADKEGEMDI